jgi:hypothetical protein
MSFYASRELKRVRKLLESPYSPSPEQIMQYERERKAEEERRGSYDEYLDTLCPPASPPVDADD